MAKTTEAQKRYQSSEKGKQSRLKYQQSLKGIETHKRYLAKRKARLEEAKKSKEITQGEIKPETGKIEVEVAKK